MSLTTVTLRRRKFIMFAGRTAHVSPEPSFEDVHVEEEAEEERRVLSPAILNFGDGQDEDGESGRQHD